MPLFSVIIPTFNRASMVGAAIDSVLAQHINDYEIIVVDDGSTDDTSARVEAFGPRVQLLRQSNRGPGPARNHGIAKACGRYVVFLDSDDLWFPWTLSVYREVSERYNEPSIIAGHLFSFQRPEELLQVSMMHVQETFYPDYLSTAGADLYVGACMAVYRRDILVQVGGFIEEHVNSEDHDLSLRAGTAPGFVAVQSPRTVAYRRHLMTESGDMIKSLEGIDMLQRREREGRYPGGRARRSERRIIIASHARPISMACLEHGMNRKAWSLYRQTLVPNLRVGRWKYLLGFPLLWIRFLLARLRKVSVCC